MNKAKNRILSAIKYLVIFLLLLVLLFPVIWMIISSVQPSSKLMNLPPEFIPSNPTLQNYIKIISNSKYLRYFENSFIVSGGTVLLCMCIAVPAGYAFSRYRFPMKSAVMTFIMSVQMFPIVVILISLYTFFMRWHLLSTYRGLILTDTAFALPLAINLMKSFFDTLPRSLDESATIDGASRGRVLWSILLPLTVPGLLAVGIYTFLNAWDDFLMALTIMQNMDMKTLTVGLAQSFLGEYAYDYGALMAFSLCGSLPVVLVFIFLQKYMISGMTAGAVKG